MRRRDGRGQGKTTLHRIGLETGDGRERVRRWQAGQGPRGHTETPHRGRGLSIAAVRIHPHMYTYLLSAKWKTGGPHGGTVVTVRKKEPWIEDDENGKGTADGKGRNGGRMDRRKEAHNLGKEPDGHTHHLPQHLKIKMEGTDTEYPALKGFGFGFEKTGAGRILDGRRLNTGNGGSSSFEARLVSIVHGTTNTSDSIHLQAARRTPREDLELCFSDGACRHSLALTQYTTVLHYCVAFNPPSRILEVENVDSKQHLLHCLLPLTAPSLRKPAAITEDVLSYRSMTGRHCFRNRTWSCENLTLVWCSASLALSEPHGFNAAEVRGTHAGTSHGTYSRTQ
ncbi:hypothetical protein JMJ77_0009087 [Colletotrichum scovillei]|uniref:Uncharacterized protein n=1 Tax=Colletotrichum scovillei TaxID=1209932 RepID=A0A9P7UAU6_9PEZI|nr:hypothetical protein JMJ78_0010805 [Colletotrichum scovillei]KAG7040812.1 hypothetical protein JMJ77_0009087 [Colletotrichum scovillei]KAG7060855.1 hypothetical protein JMJ76_0004069 [Colletotrichum scovillei]